MPRFLAGRNQLIYPFSKLSCAALVAALLSACWVWPAHAAAADAAADLRAGIQAFRAQNLEQARLLFQRAASAGLQSPRLYYNLGVVHYRLDDPAAAVIYFERAAEFPATRQIAQYNLGRCAQALGDALKAAAWYERAGRGGDPRIADLARRAASALQTQPAQAWTLEARLGGGFDSAVVGLVDQVTSQPTDEADLLHEVQVVADYHDATRDWGEWSARMQAYHLGYDSVHQANVQSLGGRLRWQRDWSARHRSTLSAGTAHEWLDGQAYQLRQSLALAWSHAVGVSRLHHQLEVEWLNSQYAGSNAIEGLRADLSSSWLRRLGSGVGLLRVSGQYNQRRRDENSPWRFAAEMLWRSPQMGPWYWAPGLQWRDSRFPDGVLPREQRVRVMLRGGSPISPSWESRVDVQYEHNRSADSNREYEHLRLLISLVWSKG